MTETEWIILVIAIISLILVIWLIKKTKGAIIIVALLIYVGWQVMEDEKEREETFNELEDKRFNALKEENEKLKKQISNISNPDNETTNTTEYKKYDPCDNFSYTIDEEGYASDYAREYSECGYRYIIKCSTGDFVHFFYCPKYSMYENTSRSSQHEAAKKACGC